MPKRPRGLSRTERPPADDLVIGDKLMEKPTPVTSDYGGSSVYGNLTAPEVVHRLDEVRCRLQESLAEMAYLTGRLLILSDGDDVPF